MVRRHRRFELLGVTLDDAPLGSATVDVWEDDEGRSQWSARVVMKHGHGAIGGRLTGSTRAGRVLTGQVVVAEGQQGPGGARTVLVELHGQGPLDDPEVAPQEDDASP